MTKRLTGRAAVCSRRVAVCLFQAGLLALLAACVATPPVSRPGVPGSVETADALASEPVAPAGSVLQAPPVEVDESTSTGLADADAAPLLTEPRSVAADAPPAVEVEAASDRTATTQPALANPAIAPTQPKPAPTAPPPPPRPVEAPPSPPQASTAPAAEATPPAAGHTLRGRVNLLAANRQSIDGRDLADAVIYYTPDLGVPAAPSRRHIMDTRSKGFSPDLLVVTTGSTVSFPNGDPILHNVYSDTPGLSFDLGLYGEGETRETRFDRAGLVAVHCNVHSAMQAKILVLDTPFFARADAQGRFEIPGVPPGLGTLVAWHPRAVALSQPMAMPASEALELRLTVSRPRAGGGR